MLSRVANSIFWLSRYLERAENVARYIDVTLNLTIDLGAGMDGQWGPLVYTSGDHQVFEDRYGKPTQQNVIHFLAFDEKNPNSILSCLRTARENARAVRDMISSVMWEELNKFYLMVQASAAGSHHLEHPYDYFQKIKLASHLLEGVTEATMSHGEAWHFARVGRLVERADKTSRILDVKYYLLLPSLADVGTPLDTIQWSALLKSASALEMYRQRHGRITPHRVVEFLILDRDFPRAMHFCLLNAEESLLAITGRTIGTFRNTAEQRLGRLRTELDYASIQDIISGGLHEFIDSFQTKLNLVGEAITETFFVLRPLTEDAASPPGESNQRHSLSQTQS